MSDENDLGVEAESLFETVRQKYGERVDEEQLEAVRKEVGEIARNAEVLRAVKLDNGDQPFFVFAPYSKDE